MPGFTSSRTWQEPKTTTTPPPPPPRTKKQHFSPTYSSSPNYTYPTKQSKQPLQHSHSFPYPRKSYYFTRELTPSSDDDPKQLTTSFPITELPRKSNKERSRRTARYRHKVVSSAVAAEYSCRATTICSNGDICTGECFPDNSASSTDTSQDPADAFPPDFHSDLALTAESFDDILPWSQSTSCSNFNFNNDIVIDVDKKSLTTKLNKDLPVLDKVLPPIITKPEKFDEHLDQNITGKKETNQPTKPNRTSTQQRTPVVGSSRRHSENPPGGVRLRVNSPRIGNRRVQGRKSMSRKSFSESLAIVKASFDPRRDFRESMVEMIVENNIRASKDLEDLLACL